MAFESQEQTDGWSTFNKWISKLKQRSTVTYFLMHDKDYIRSIELLSSNSERFAKVWNDPIVIDEFQTIWYEDKKRLAVQRDREENSKSIDLAKKWRERGNTAFKGGYSNEALKHYTDSVRFSPYTTPDSPQHTLALALANRSAALYSLTKYRLCLRDINLAISLGYPKENLFKLKIRKVKCLHILAMWDYDGEIIKSDLKTQLESRSTKDYIKTEIIALFKFIEKTKSEDFDKVDEDVVDESQVKICNHSRFLPSAADCVEMAYDEDLGRYLVNGKDVSCGRLMLVEEPFVCNLASQYWLCYCYNCYRKLYGCGIGCDECTKILYCSLECKELKHQVHKYECNKLIEIQNYIGVAYLAAHIMFAIDFDTQRIPVMIKKKRESELKTADEILSRSLPEWKENYYRNDYASVLSLLDHAPDYDTSTMISFMITAVYLMVAFKDLYPEKLSSLESEQQIGSVVLRHLLQFQTNLIAILDQHTGSAVDKGTELIFPKETSIGTGLYPTVSLLNHSCAPNIIPMYNGNCFMVRASKTLECGTQLSYCYGPCVSSMTKKDRQLLLKEQYFFTCECEACIDDRENESRALKCPLCGGPVIYDLDLQHRCTKCKQENFIDMKKNLELSSRYQEAVSQIEDEPLEPAERLEKYKSLESKLADIVYWRNPTFIMIKAKLIDTAVELEDMELAVVCCQEELELCKKAYGEKSYETTASSMKLANIEWQKAYEDIEEMDTIEEKKVAASTTLKDLMDRTGKIRQNLKDLIGSMNIAGVESSFDTELKFLSEVHSHILRYQKQFFEE